MEKNRPKCETCQYRGYNPYLCKWHKKKITDIDIKNCHPQNFYKKVSKIAVFGAGVGVVVATAGLAAAPVVGMKTIIGHGIATKVTAGGGAVGAGFNVARRPKKNQAGAKPGKKRNILLPLYLKKGS